MSELDPKLLREYRDELVAERNRIQAEMISSVVRRLQIEKQLEAIATLIGDTVDYGQVPGNRMTIRDHCAVVLERSPSPMTAFQLTDALIARGYDFKGVNPAGTVRTVLVRWPEFVNPSRGLWTLARETTPAEGEVG